MKYYSLLVIIYYVLLFNELLYEIKFAQYQTTPSPYKYLSASRAAMQPKIIRMEIIIIMYSKSGTTLYIKNTLYRLQTNLHGNCQFIFLLFLLVQWLITKLSKQIKDLFSLYNHKWKLKSIA